MDKWHLLAAGFLALILTGCTSLMNVHEDDLMGNRDMTPSYEEDPLEMICKGVEGAEPCSCFFCEKVSDWPPLLARLSSYFDATLSQGSCRIQPCSEPTYRDILGGNDNVFIRTVAVGNGPSFTSADLANRYCSFSLQFANKWMIGRNSPPEKPLQSRATCWLHRNILPVYMYYTAGKFINSQRSYEIAQEMNGAGPVLLATEINLDSSSPSSIPAVKDQLLAFDTCDNCLTVLSVKLEDTLALSAILNDPNPVSNPFNPALPPRRYREMVDVVGFGFRANDYQACKSEQVIGKAFAFSRKILTEFSKPTIWLYVGASKGPNVDGTCEWSDPEIRNFYQNLFALTQGMASSGVLGFSFYEFMDGSGPLPCNDIQACEFGVIGQDGTQKEYEINSWSSLCKYFGDEPFISGSADKTQYRSPVVFSRNGQGRSCDFQQNTKLFNKLSSDVNPDPSFFETGLVLPDEDSEKIISCGEACIADHPVPSVELYDGEDIQGERFDPLHCLYPEMPLEIPMMVEAQADDQDISANYFRAIVEELNSQNSPFLIKCVLNSNSSCNPGALTMQQICAEVPDPTGEHYCYESFECPTGQKPCRYGFSQTKDFPGKRYPLPVSGMMPEIRDCGGDEYNPFNPTMSICNGVKKFRRYLLDANAFLDANWVELTLCQNTMTEADRPWAAYFLATFLYNNETMGDYPAYAATATLPPVTEWIANFRDASGQCSGGANNHYITYVRTQFSNFPSRVLTRYFSALHFCDSNCAECCGE